jgi:hypothetical protein
MRCLRPGLRTRKRVRAPGHRATSGADSYRVSADPSDEILQGNHLGQQLSDSLRPLAKLDSDSETSGDRASSGENESSIACLSYVKQSERVRNGSPDFFVDLDELLTQQQHYICRRRHGMRSSVRRDSTETPSNVPSSDPAARKNRVNHVAHTLEEKWAAYLRTLPKETFESMEALNSRAEKAVRGKPLFSGIRVDEENCSDVQRVYRLCFESKIGLGQPRGTYDQFRSAAGQYLRTYLSFRTDRALEICKPGGLFTCVADFKLIRAFIGQYQVRASATTVMGKALHLRRLADEAISYFTETNSQELKGRCMSVAAYLRSVAASYKTEARRYYRSRNTTDDRVGRGALLHPDDFDQCLRKATQAMENVMQFVEDACEQYDGDMEDICNAVGSREKMAEKWSINILAALVLSGGGQRPQVYAQLDLPEESELEIFDAECRANKQYFTLRAGLEKTTRSMDLPKVLFPRMMLKFVRFHVVAMRPILVQLVEGSAHVNCKTLLLHTRRGIPLKSCDVTRSLGRFLERIDPELANITPMAIRGSYASMMLQAHRRNEIFRTFSENEFLQFLAKQMNTSVEQLATTYASCEVDAFENVANEIMGVFSKETLAEEDGMAGEGQGGESARSPAVLGRLWD